MNADSKQAAPKKPQGGDRIAKVMARAGLCSRREAERWIADGRVRVDGEVLSTPALTVTDANTVEVDGKALPGAAAMRLWRYHKPPGLLTSHADPQGRPTVFDRLPKSLGRVISIGRLDLNSEGLLLLTNDGAVKRQLELPSTGWLRKYRVRVNGRVTEPQLEPLRQGIKADGEDFQPMIVTLDRQQGANAWLTVGLREGKNREIRRAMEAVGLTVNRLIRTSYGPFQLGQLKPGEVEEVRRRVLRDQLGLDTKDDEDAAESTTKPRKVIVRRNKSRETPSEADLFGDRPGGRPGRGAKPAPRTGKTSTGKPSTGKPASAKAATADAKPAQGRTTGGKAMGSKAMGGRPAAGKPGPDGDRAKGGDKPLRTTRPAKPRPQPTRG